MSTLSHPLTYADLERKRASSDERLELIEGEIFVTPSPTAWHQIVALRLGSRLKRAVMDTGLGLVLPAPFDVAFDDQSVLQPDLLVLLNDRASLLERARVAGAPTLVIEIISPSTETRDRERKRSMYAREGVPEYWLVDPQRRNVTSFSESAHGEYQRATTTEDVLISVAIPDVTIDLGEIFAPLWRDR